MVIVLAWCFVLSFFPPFLIIYLSWCVLVNFSFYMLCDSQWWYNHLGLNHLSDCLLTHSLGSGPRLHTIMVSKGSILYKNGMTSDLLGCLFLFPLLIITFITFYCLWFFPIFGGPFILVNGFYFISCLFIWLNWSPIYVYVYLFQSSCLSWLFSCFT